jgi:hypothetical protein
MQAQRIAGYGNTKDKTTMTIGVNMITAISSHIP